MTAYLDNSATTKPEESVINVMLKTMNEDYGNPSSLHMFGVRAEKYINTSREIIAGILKCKEKEICFTSGGTESNNMALVGAAFAAQRRGNHIITSSVEHASVDMPLKYLEKHGFEVTRLPVNREGKVSPGDFKRAIRDTTIMASIMYVNNEVGAVQPIGRIADAIKQSGKNILFHVDAVQAFGKMNIFPGREGIDLMSVSAHKIHGPKGAGFLYIRDKVKVNPLILGGGQQNGMRSGTENVTGIAGMAEAARVAYCDLPDKISHMQKVKDHFIDRISALEGVKVNSMRGDEGAPHIVSVSFEGIKSEVLLHALEEREIYVSSGSACSSNKKSVSATLKSMGIGEKYLDSTLRFSFSCHTAIEETDYAVDTIKELMGRLRMYRHS